GASYLVGTPSSATGMIDDAADVIFVATLRPLDRASGGGYGTAAVRVAGNKAFADLTLSFGNLGANQTGADFYLLGAAGAVTPALTFPLGQASTQRWTFDTAQGLTPAQILS